MRHFADVKSQGLNSTDDIVITGAKYVEKDSPIKLTCNATGEDHAPDEIDWFKNGDKLETNYARQIYIQKRVSLTTKTILSILEIKEAKMDDAGMYICRTSDLQITSKRVNVLNAGTSNVKRGTEKDNDAMIIGSSGRRSSGMSSLRASDASGLVLLLLWSAIISELLRAT
ncbi:immunoglobulin heavy variable 1-18-like [Gigantopelta aegis]|uniref:immunoglobulin heavy variable 1-18-like n=1 Tax=Gigantopelta aegis TaxID=1735272 RepID=UPI001B88B04C|nr:immunoglobulin heavy variable 1-18-like [Gigantopelta aegis]